MKIRYHLVNGVPQRKKEEEIEIRGKTEKYKKPRNRRERFRHHPSGRFLPHFSFVR